jgi:uncharacterized protein (TIGR02145 family)
VPVLLDFGLACKTNLKDLNVSTIGTFGYAAPEQQDGAAEHTIAFSADVYSVGVILLEMLTPSFSVLKAGKNFAGKIDRNDPERRQKLEDRLNSFRKILDGQIAKLKKNNAGAFKNFILKCLELAPEERFQSGQEALDQFMSVAAQFRSERDSEFDATNRIDKGSMTDPRDGKTYKTVKIGSKIWLAENLGYKTPNSLCYDNDEEIANRYGRLYTLSDAKKACPPGWRLPSKKDIEELIAAAGGERVAGKKLKSASGWQANDGKSGNGVDALGFSALPAGGWLTDSENPDDPEENGFFLIGEKFDFWYDSGMLELYNHSNCADIEPFHINYVDNFYSIRCIKDESVKPAVQQPKQNIPVGNSLKKNVAPKKSKAPVVIGILAILVILLFTVVAVVYSNKGDEESSVDNQTQIDSVVNDSRDEDSSADNQPQNDSILKMYLRDGDTYNTEEIGVDSTSYTKDEDKDGEPDYQDKSSNTLRGMKIDKKGINVKSGTTVLTEPSYKPIDDIERNVNAAPVMRDIPDFTIKENQNDGVIATIKLDQYARDKDHRFEELEWSWTGNKFLQVKYDKFNRTITVSQPYENWNGKPERITFTVTNPEGVKTEKTATFSVIPVNDPDGESDYQDQDQDGVPDYQDKCPNTIRGAEINKKGCPLNEKENLEKLKKGISFESGTTVFNLASYRTLNDIMKLLTKFPDVNIEIQSHTDDIGDEENNMNLSQARAQSVVDYLISKGIDANRLRAVGFGSKKPIADNSKKAGRAKNRRVELVPYYQDQ